ncbi:MAG: TIGR02996 domain-containing protein, partial [Deltaproteobacteria bacterium]|nr:TIGR02996 domain-containing protein [Deltaproteobacteria bacterium]
MMTDGELAELLRSVIARPDDLDVLRVYADVLIERGELRGEMIAVQLQRREQDSPALVARERELAIALDVAVVAQLDQPGTAFSWHRGFLDVVDFMPTRERRQLADTLRVLGTLPVARKLRRIVVRFVEPGWGAVGPITSMLARVAPQ